jgi:hypothetical protein
VLKIVLSEGWHLGMKPVTPLLQSGQPRQFLFRGNAGAAAGFLTRMGGTTISLDPNRATTHGESCLPLAGGVSHSFVQKPGLASPQLISYEAVWASALGAPQSSAPDSLIRVRSELGFLLHCTFLRPILRKRRPLLKFGLSVGQS